MSIGSRVPYIASIVPNDWNSVLRFNRDVQKYMASLASSDQTVYLAELFLTGSTASRLLATDASQEVVSTDLASWVTGTANEIDITDDADGTITIGIVNPLIVGKGGTGATTLTNHGILLGSGTDAITALGSATNGQIPVGSTGADPVLATLVAGDCIEIENEAGSVTISSDVFDAGTSDTGLDVLRLSDVVPFSEPIMLTGDGKVTRHLRIGAVSFYKKDDPPAEGLIGIYPVLNFDPDGDEQCYYCDLVCFRLEEGTAFEANVDWTYTGDDAGKVVWGLEFIGVKAGEAVAGSTATITGISAGGHTGGTLVRTKLTSTGSGLTGLEAHDALGLRLYRDADDGVNDTLNEDASLIQLHLHFSMDKLGE